MYKLSDIVSKQVIALSGARLVGTVANVRFSPSLKKADSLLLLDNEENDDGYLCLPVKMITTMKEDSVVIRSVSRPLTVFRGNAANPVNLPCCNQDGKILGRICDIEFTEDFSVESFAVSEKTYPADTLLSYSDCLVIFNDSGKEIKLPKPKARKPKLSDAAVKATITSYAAEKKEHTEPKNDIANQEQSEEEAMRQPQSAQSDKPTVTTPTAVPSPAPDFGAPDFSFLLGKRLIRALCTSDGRLIAAENDVITSDVISQAAKENKLVQLALRAI